MNEQENDSGDRCVRRSLSVGAAPRSPEQETPAPASVGQDSARAPACTICGLPKVSHYNAGYTRWDGASFHAFTFEAPTVGQIADKLRTVTEDLARPPAERLLTSAERRAILLATANDLRLGSWVLE